MHSDAITSGRPAPNKNGMAGSAEPTSVAKAITNALRRLRWSSERYCRRPCRSSPPTASPIAPAMTWRAGLFVASRPATTPSVDVMPSNEPKMALPHVRRSLRRLRMVRHVLRHLRRWGDGRNAGVSRISKSFTVAEVGPVRLAGFAGWLLWSLRAPRFPDGFQEPREHAVSLDDQLRRARPSRANHHHAAGHGTRVAASGCRCDQGRGLAARHDLVTTMTEPPANPRP